MPRPRSLSTRAPAAAASALRRPRTRGPAGRSSPYGAAPPAEGAPARSGATAPAGCSVTRPAGGARGRREGRSASTPFVGSSGYAACAGSPRTSRPASSTSSWRSRFGRERAVERGAALVVLAVVLLGRREVLDELAGEPGRPPRGRARCDSRTAAARRRAPTSAVGSPGSVTIRPSPTRSAGERHRLRHGRRRSAGCPILCPWPGHRQRVARPLERHPASRRTAGRAPPRIR